MLISLNSEYAGCPCHEGVFDAVIHTYRDVSRYIEDVIAGFRETRFGQLNDVEIGHVQPVACIVTPVMGTHRIECVVISLPNNDAMCGPWKVYPAAAKSNQVIVRDRYDHVLSTEDRNRYYVVAGIVPTLPAFSPYAETTDGTCVGFDVATGSWHRNRGGWSTFPWFHDNKWMCLSTEAVPVSYKKLTRSDGEHDRVFALDNLKLVFKSHDIVDGTLCFSELRDASKPDYDLMSEPFDEDGKEYDKWAKKYEWITATLDVAFMRKIPKNRNAGLSNDDRPF